MREKGEFHVKEVEERRLRRQKGALRMSEEVSKIVAEKKLESRFIYTFGRLV